MENILARSQSIPTPTITLQTTHPTRCGSFWRCCELGKDRGSKSVKYIAAQDGPETGSRLACNGQPMRRSFCSIKISVLRR